MSIKFLGVKGKNRLRLKPKTPESQMIVDSVVHTPTLNGTPIEIYDGSFGICLGQSEISCVGAYNRIGITGNLDYSTGWTLFINDVDYGHFSESKPFEYSSQWEFDYLINVSVYQNVLWINNTSPADVRIKLLPDNGSGITVGALIDRDPDFPDRPSENAFIAEDGSINVCLRVNLVPEAPM